MKVIINKFEAPTDHSNTLKLEVSVKFSAEYFQTLYWDGKDGKNLEEHGEHIGEEVKKAIKSYIINTKSND